MKIVFLSSLFLILYFPLVAANDTIYVESTKYHIDHSSKLILSDKSVYELNNSVSGTIAVIKLDEFYHFSTIVSELKYGLKYTVSHDNKNYSLYFTALPIIVINTAHPIPDEPKVLSDFTMTDTSGFFFQSFAGIEKRGASTQGYPKKSYSIEFWEDEEGEDNRNFTYGNMRYDDDWLLLAMFNEPLRLNNVVSYDLWQKIHSPHYKVQEPGALSGVRTLYVELFLNNKYNGVYLLCEKIDEKQLQLKKSETSVKGQLYKGESWGASTFMSLPAYNNNSFEWGGFEMMYPEEESIINWHPLYEFVEFVMYSADNNFYAQIETKFNTQNAIDYFIFLNLVRATDNTGKNIYLAKYNTGSPYFYVPWDMDGSLGIIWTGEKENKTNDILSNGLYNRLLNNCEEPDFYLQAKTRWETLRTGLITKDSIMKLIRKNHDWLNNNGVYKREEMVWSHYDYDASYLDYHSQWLEDRIAFLDQYFDSNCGTIPSSLVEKTISKTSLHYNHTTNTYYFSCTDNLLYKKYTIIDHTGKVVYSDYINASETELKTEHLKTGLYLIKIEDLVSPDLKFVKF